MEDWQDCNPDHRPSSSAIFVRQVGDGTQLVWIFEVRGLGVLLATEVTNLDYPPQLTGLGILTEAEIRDT